MRALLQFILPFCVCVACIEDGDSVQESCQDLHKVLENQRMELEQHRANAKRNEQRFRELEDQLRKMSASRPRPPPMNTAEDSMARFLAPRGPRSSDGNIGTHREDLGQGAAVEGKLLSALASKGVHQIGPQVLQILGQLVAEEVNKIHEANAIVVPCSNGTHIRNTTTLQKERKIEPNGWFQRAEYLQSPASYEAGVAIIGTCLALLNSFSNEAIFFTTVFPFSSRLYYLGGLPCKVDAHEGRLLKRNELPGEWGWLRRKYLPRPVPF